MADMLKAFYSKPRKMFMPLTSTDIARRTGMTDMKIRGEITRQRNKGMLVQIEYERQDKSVPFQYELTEAGRNAVMASMIEGVM